MKPTATQGYTSDMLAPSHNSAIATTAAARVYTLDVPMIPGKTGPVPPLTENARLHHFERNRRVQLIRNRVYAAAITARIPQAKHLTVTLHYAPGDNRRRDEDNLVPTLKAACDALARGKRRDWVGLELVPDDTPEHMTKNMPIIHPGKGPRRLWLEIEATP